MNIKVAAFTVSEKSINISVYLEHYAIICVKIGKGCIMRVNTLSLLLLGNMSLLCIPKTPKRVRW